MKEMLIPLIDEKNIYARYYDNKHNHTLLYLHGGPGASSSSFQYCAHKLSKYMNVILIDERGVLRSDKIEAHEKCTVNMLIDDCESVRRYLNIDKLIILGHSFGGFIALQYANKYPTSVEKIIFENPTFDFIESIKSIQSKVIKALLEAGQDILVDNLKFDVINDEDVRKFMSKFGEIPEKIRSEAYHLKSNEEYEEEQKRFLEVKVDSNERWSYATTHFENITQDINAYKNISGLISKLKCPSLLICGEFDPVFTKDSIKKYKEDASMGKVVIVENCGHFIHTDKCDTYVKIIGDFTE